jgi:predicted amidophosphoribosyltransferase
MAVQPIYCCDFCGRDTRRRSRVCSLCLGSVPDEAEPVGEDDSPSRDEEILAEVEEALREAMG